MNEDIFHIGVKAIVCDQRQNVLVLRTHDNAQWNAYWDIPGGRVERGESLTSTLVREVYEETGIEIEPGMVKALGSHLTDIRIPLDDQVEVGLIFCLFYCSIQNDPIIRLSNEHVKYEWVTPEVAAKRMASRIPPEFITDL